MQLVQTLVNLWASACRDKAERPSCVVKNGEFVFTIRGNREGWGDLIQAAGIPQNALIDMSDTKFEARWPSVADLIFGSDGIIASRLPNYEMRLPQLHMARLVQRAIEMKQPAVIEAGTGTGKGLAYAAVAMHMNKRVVISTSNKALQMQLYTKDIPFLQTIYPGKKQVLVQGKNNYACKLKAENLETGAYTIEGPLLDWYLQTTSGNTEELPFAVDEEYLRRLTVDKYCTGKMCDRYEECFYYAAKRERASADVLITNHALLALHQLYPGAGILPPVDLVVVDEAHKFPDYVRSALGAEFQLDTIQRRVALAEKYDISTSMVEEAMQSFFREVRDVVGDSTEREIGIVEGWEFAGGWALRQELRYCGEQIWPEAQLPADREQKKLAADARSIRNTADDVGVFSKETAQGYVRWIEVNDGLYKCFYVPHDVAWFVRRMAGFEAVNEAPTDDHTHCTRCGRKLTAQAVNVLEGKPYGPDCIRYVDPMGDAEQVALEEWLSQEHPPAEPIQRDPTPIVFTSATLAAPDMAAFLRECGLPYALQMIAASPFDFERNALLYVPPVTVPAPGKPSHLAWLTEEVARLVHASKGGAFVLFTSYAAMKHVEQRLHHEMLRAGYNVFVQRKMPKLEIIKQFPYDGKGVLFATKSFWEGVSIDGSALRMVIIDKLPFEAPSPLNAAQEAALKEWARGQGMDDKEADWYPFEALRLPRMTIDLKQGAGRLIRTATDWGVIAILDARLRSAQYARRLVLPALPPARLTCNLWEVDQFFADRQKLGTQIGELSAVEQFGVEAGHLVDPIPF